MSFNFTLHEGNDDESGLGFYQMRYLASTHQTISTPPDTRLNEQHFVVFRRNHLTKVAELFVDQQLVVSETVDGDFVGWNRNLLLGIANEFPTECQDIPEDCERPWRGLYHDVAIYCHALSDGQLQTAYNSFSERTAP